MSEELSKDTIGELFMCIMQHMKCIEVRIEFARCTATQKQRFALKNAVGKVQVAINHLCDLLGDSDMVMKVKKHLDSPVLLEVMLLTEKLSTLKDNDDIEHIVDYIDQYIETKYGKET